MFLAQFLVEKNIFHERLGFNFFPAKLGQAKRNYIFWKLIRHASMFRISSSVTGYFPPATVNISLQTSPRTSSHTYKDENVVVNLALRIVSKSLAPPY